MIHFMNEIAGFFVNQSWQILVVFIVIAAGSLALRKASAHWRYLLWLLVLIKCVTPSVFSVPLAALSENEAPLSIASNIATADNSVEIQMQTELPNIHHAPVSGASVASNFPRSDALPRPAATSTPATKVPTDLWKTTAYWSAICWLVGSSLFTIIVLAKAVLLQRRLRQLRRPACSALRMEVSALADVLGMKSSPEVWLVDDCSQPFVCGLIRGSVYLPTDFASRTMQDCDSILAHELAHVRRYDAAVNVLQLIAQGLFFFHPLVWWANLKLRQEREKCCDEIAIAALTVRPRDYSTTIVDALITESKTFQPMATLAIAGSVKNIEERIKTIMTPNRKFYKRPTWTAMLTILLLAGLLIPTTFTLTARAEPKQEVPKKVDETSPEKAKIIIPIEAKRPKGSKLSFRIVYSRPKSSKNGNVNEALEARAMKSLYAHGPNELASHNGTVTWLPVRKGIGRLEPHITSEYQGKLYLLVQNGASNVMIASGVNIHGRANRSKWGLKSVYRTLNQYGKPIVGYRFDQSGSDMFASLTSKNIGKALAVIVDGVVYAAPIIQTRISDSAVIPNNFSEKEVKALIKTLKTGMPPVKKSTTQQMAIGAKLVARLVDTHGRAMERQSLLMAPLSKGYAEFINRGLYWADKKGVVTIDKITPGKHRFVINAQWPKPTFVDLVVRANGLNTKVTVQPRQAGDLLPDLDIKVSLRAKEGMWKATLLDVTITNNTDKPYVLTNTDLQLVSINHRVFPPDSQQHVGAKVPPRGKGALRMTLDSSEYTQKGLWCARYGEKISWPGPVADKEKGHVYYRVKVGVTQSLGIPLPQPVKKSTLGR